MINGAPILNGQRKLHHRIATTLAGLMAAGSVHPEIIAAPIPESSRSDMRDMLSCDALIRYRRHTGLLLTSEPLPTVTRFWAHGALLVERGRCDTRSSSAVYHDGPRTVRQAVMKSPLSREV
jgi:hypothetical protein